MSIAKDIPIFDESALRAIAQLSSVDEPDVLGKIKGLFLTMAPESLGRMKAEHKSNNLGEIQKIAHKLKSGAGSLTLKRVELVCQLIEDAEGATPSQLSSLLADLELELNEACQCLRKFNGQ